MNAWQFIGSSLLGGGLGTVVALGIFRRIGDGWVESILEKKRAGYSKELAGLQARYAEELEAIKAEVGRAIFVTNVHFETEFDALKRTFEAATALKQNLMGLRPLLEVTVQDEQERRRTLNEKFNNCIGVWNGFISLYQNLSPFYPKEVYDRFDECAKAANVEMMQIQIAGGNVTPEWFKQAVENQNRFMAAYDAASELIRTRIATLAVVGRRT